MERWKQEMKERMEEEGNCWGGRWTGRRRRRILSVMFPTCSGLQAEAMFNS